MPKTKTQRRIKKARKTRLARRTKQVGSRVKKPLQVDEKKPSIIERHKAALQIISENVGNPKRIKEELMKIGYSESYIDSHHMRRTSSFQTLLEDQLPDKDLTAHHKQLMNISGIGHITMPVVMSDEEIIETVEVKFGFPVMKIKHGEQANHVYYSVPNYKAKQAALDMAYKLKSKYGDITVRHKFGEYTDEELEAELASELSEGIGDPEGAEAEEGQQ